MERSDSAVAVRDVVKRFEGHTAVDALSLDVPEGDIFGLLGPNGAGKSTTIRMIMDIIRPDSGEIRVFGAPSGNAAKDLLGYLPEERGLYRKMKVIEMLEFAGSIRGLSLAAARKESTTWLERLGIGDWAVKKVEELSKGMQQKVQFITAVLGKPKLLILDEPFSGMDPVNQELFKDVILEMNRAGTTIIFSTHQMDTAERLCTAIALIHRGKTVLYGPLARVKSEFGRNAITMEFDGDAGFLSRVPGVASLSDTARSAEIRLAPQADPQAILKAAIERLTIRRFEIQEPTLHSIFIGQVGGATLVPATDGSKAEAARA